MQGSIVIMQHVSINIVIVIKISVMRNILDSKIRSKSHYSWGGGSLSILNYSYHYALSCDTKCMIMSW